MPDWPARYSLGDRLRRGEADNDAAATPFGRGILLRTALVTKGAQTVRAIQSATSTSATVAT
jgi:hypothetical protein